MSAVTPITWLELAAALDEYDEIEDHPDPEKRGPVKMFIAALRVVKHARAVVNEARRDEAPVDAREALAELRDRKALEK